MAQKKAKFANSINGVWVNQEKSIQLTVFLQDKEYGVVNGWLAYEGELISMLGFTDTLDNNNILQSVSISGYMLNTFQPISLIGRISQDANTLILSRWLANSTKAESAYFQANSENWELTKKS